jgi:hypothetical protein
VEVGFIIMEANRKTTRTRVRREARRMEKGALTLVEEVFLMEAHRKTTRTETNRKSRIRVRREFRREPELANLARGKVLDGGQQEDHQKKGEKGSESWDPELSPW